MKPANTRRIRAFILIDLMVVIAILVAMPALAKAKERNIPVGSNLTMMDNHFEWRKFNYNNPSVPRTGDLSPASGGGFWW